MPTSERQADFFADAETAALMQRLVEAVKFYAEEKNWEPQNIPLPMSTLVGVTPIECDRGRFARKVLKDADLC